MKKLVFLLFLPLGFIACKDKKNTPDVSNIKTNLVVDRFDQDFFALDTMNLEKELNALQLKYPSFLNLFLQNIVGVNDANGVKAFYRSYKSVFDSSQHIYKDFSPIKTELEKAFRYVKYYFPSYQLPASLIPVIGPMNSRDDLARMANGDYSPNFIGPGFIGVSLQFYMGKDYSLYNDEYFVNNIIPLYRSRRFTRDYIAADVMKLVTDDIFPDKSNTKPLIDQMIEKGKQWWLLDKFLPDMPDSLKTGYTQHQLDWCAANEGLIWSYIVKNENLYSVNPATIQTYIGEGPFTSVFSQEDSPGNIGPWVGRQIIQKFAAKNPTMKPEQIMQTPVAQIIEDAKYKPK